MIDDIAIATFVTCRERRERGLAYIALAQTCYAIRRQE